MRASLLLRSVPVLALLAGELLIAQSPPVPQLPEPPRRKKAPTALSSSNAAGLPGATAAKPSTSLPGLPRPGIIKPDALAWDAKLRELDAKEGQQSIDFKFALTNVWTNAVTINGTQTSCGCTVAKLPSTPWVIEPGGTGEITGTMNLFGKFGTVTKTVTVNSDVGSTLLTVKVNIPMPDPKKMRESDRQRNLAVASADRQAVFRGECAGCHVTPTIAKRGKELYSAACGICHDAENKASMVPGLRDLKHPTDYDFWLTWIKNGKPNSLMPAFDLKQGGILDQAQIESLAEYLDSPEFGKKVIQASLPVAPEAK